MSKWTQAFAATTAVMLMTLIAACSTQAKRVDCDGDLKPINRPAPSAPAPSRDPQATG